MSFYLFILSRKPFHLLQTIRSQESYSKDLARFVTFALNVVLCDGAKPDSITTSMVIAATKLQTSLSSGDGVVETLHLFLLFVLTQVVHVDDNDKDYLLAHWIMLSSVNSAGAYMVASSITHTIAVCTFWIRLACFLDVKHFKKGGKDLVQLYCNPNEPSVYETIIGYHVLIKSLSVDESKPRVIIKSGFGSQNSTLFINGSEMDLNTISTVYANALHSLKSLLSTLLFQQPHLIDLDLKLESVVDNVTDTTVGLHLLHEKMNPYQSSLKTTLLLSLLSNPQLCSHFFNTSGFKVQSVNSYLKQQEDFITLFHFAMHVSCGAPPRVSESTTFTFANTQDDCRSVYWVYDKIMLLASYNKTESMTGQKKIIPRFIPVDLSHVFMRYLCLVHPFVALLKSQGNQRMDPLVFSMDARELRDSFVCQFADKITMNVSSWRHVVKCILTHHPLMRQSSELVMNSY